MYRSRLCSITSIKRKETVLNFEDLMVYFTAQTDRMSAVSEVAFTRYFPTGELFIEVMKDVEAARDDNKESMKELDKHFGI